MAEAAVVIGKGDKQPRVRFEAKIALDKYLRVRAKMHKQADLPHLWKRRPSPPGAGVLASTE